MTGWMNAPKQPKTERARKSTREDLWQSPLGRSILAEQQKSKATARPSPTEHLSPPPRYVKMRQEKVWDGKRWVDIDRPRWERDARRGAARKLLEVGDVGPPTVVQEHGSSLTIRRGCLVDGNREVVHDTITVGKFEERWRGGLCITCHQEWREMSINQRGNFGELGWWVTQRLQAEGYVKKNVQLTREVELPPEGGVKHIGLERLYIKDWPQKCWAYRVLRADDPSIEEPPRKAFGWLPAKLDIEAERLSV